MRAPCSGRNLPETATGAGNPTAREAGRIDVMRSDPSLGRAEAPHRAMLAYIDDRSDPRNAYPAYLAAFVVVGEGAVMINDGGD